MNSLQALTLTGPGGNTGALVSLRGKSNDERLAAFVAMAPLLTDKEYWSTLGNLWVLTSLPGYQGDAWRKLFSSQRPGRAYLMNEAERATLAALPERVTLYRAASYEFEYGMAWTLNLDIARLFQARRWGHQRIWVTTIDKSDIVAYFADHREVVILNPVGVEFLQPQLP